MCTCVQASWNFDFRQNFSQNKMIDFQFEEIPKPICDENGDKSELVEADTRCVSNL